MNNENYWPFDDSQSGQLFLRMMRGLKESKDGGVAFFGAGTSVRVGFPTWTQFHKKLLATFGALPQQPSAFYHEGLLIDIDYHANRDPVESLSYVKKEFASPITEIPPVVRAARGARSLRYFFTTNFDDVLYEAAYGESVSVYPEYIPMDARFVYLHGRASTASSIHEDLVLGTTGYSKAYDDLKGGFAKAKLRMLASYTVVFLGFSMTDPSVARSIEEIARAVRYRRVRPVDGDDVEAVSILNWFILLKAPTRSDPHREEEKRSRERQLSEVGVTPIWYMDGGERDPYRGLLEVIQQIQRESRELTVSEKDPRHVELLMEAERIASEDFPSSAQIRRAHELLRGHSGIAQAFLAAVDGVAWFRALRDTGSLHPKPSLVTASGERRAPRWQAIGMLQRVARTTPVEVRDFLLSLKTDNWFAARQAFGVLDSLDDSFSEDVAAHLAAWAVEAMAVDSYILLDISRAAEGLSRSGKPRAAVKLIESTILCLGKTDLTFSEGTTIRFSEAVAPILAQSPSGIDALEHARLTSLVREWGTPEQDKLRFSRPAIEPHRMNLPERSVVGLMVETTRETLLKVEDARRRTVGIQTLLMSRWPTERRIGIAHCFLRRSDFRANESIIVTQENLSNPDLFHELAKLIVECVEELSNHSIQILKDFVKSLQRGEIEIQRYEYMLWAALLPPEFLPEPLDKEKRANEDEESRLFRDFYVSRTFTPSAPMDAASFATMAATLTTDQLLDLVREPANAGVNITWRHNASAMWALLAEYAREQGTLSPLLRINEGDIRRHATWMAIEAMPEIAGDDLVLWGEVLDWTDRTIALVAPHQFWPLGRLLRTCAKEATA